MVMESVNVSISSYLHQTLLIAHHSAMSTVRLAQDQDLMNA